jgi:hypothetical protein
VRGEIMKRGTLTLCFAIGVCVLALAVPNFSGTWVGDTTKNDPGAAAGGRAVGQPASLESIMIVKHEGDSLQVDTRLGDRPSVQVKYRLDGNEHTLPSERGGDLVYKSKWDGEKLVIEGMRTVATPFGTTEIKTKEEWMLSDNGQVLTVVTTTSDLRGDRTQKKVYNKK